MKGLGWFILIIALLVAVPQGVHSETPTPEPPARTPTISEQVLAKAQQQSTVAVIVKLDVDAQVEADLPSPQAVRDQQVTIAAAQQQLLQHLPAGATSGVRTYKTIPFVAMRIDSSALDTLAQAPGVVHVAPDTKRRLALRESIPIIGANIAHERGFSGKGWTVAVIDTGVESSHPFLANKVVEEACFSTNNPADGLESVCPNGQNEQIGPGAAAPCTFEEGCDHGTHVAGIVAGKDDDMVGVASDATLIAIQAVSKATSGTEVESALMDSDIIAGLEYVYGLRGTHQIAAVNLSLGNGEYASVEECDAREGNIYRDMVNNLRAADIAVIAASGNEELKSAMGSPGCISGIISVGAVDDSDTIADFSNVAPFLDLFAPGVSIQSSVLNGAFNGMDGTSQATPHVAGAWAVLKQANPTASVDEILEKLKTTGVPISSADGSYTTPRIRIDAALNVESGIRAPINLTATARSSRSHPAIASLWWQDKSDNETGFRIERGRYNSSELYNDWGEWEVIAEVGANVTVYEDTDVECGWEGYRYRVQAVMGETTSDYSNIAEVLILTCPIPGDCNSDQSVVASDMGAIALEIADERFDYFGCDANRDRRIDTADIACSVRLIFGLQCETATASSIVPGGNTPSQGIDDEDDDIWPDDPDDIWPDDPEEPPAATLIIPERLTVRPNQRFTVPVTLSVHSGTISSLALRLQYNESYLTFDRNAPDAIRFAGLPAEFTGIAPMDETVMSGTVLVAVTDQEAPLAGIPDGTVVAEITFLVNDSAGGQSTRLMVTHNSFGDDQGKSVAGTSIDGVVEISTEEFPPPQGDAPRLALPAEVTANDAQVAEIPVRLQANGNELGKVGFVLDYDDWLELDGDITFPAGMRGTVTEDTTYTDGKLSIEVETDAVYAPFPDNPDGVEIARMRLKLLSDPPSPSVPSVRFSQTVPPLFIYTNGNSVEGAVSDGTIIRGAVTPQPPTQPVYLPIIRQ